MTVTVHVPPKRIANGEAAIGITTADGTRTWCRSIHVYGPSRMIQTDEPDQMNRHIVMSFDDDTAYAYGRDPEYLSNSSVLEYRLYAAAKDVEVTKGVKLVGSSVDWKRQAQVPEERLTALNFRWKVEHPPLLVRAMALANDTLFVAGPPDVVDEKAMWGRSNEPEYKAKMREQVEALEGAKGAVLWAVSKKDGTRLSELKLDWLPAFDGMIAAGGRLYVTTADGKVVCLE